MASEAPLKYHQNWELRAGIAARAGVDTDRYSPGSGRGLTKAHLYAVAAHLGDPPDDLTLAELYEWVCDQCGVPYNGTAGNQWGLGRVQLKAIFRALDGAGGGGDGA